MRIMEGIPGGWVRRHGMTLTEVLVSVVLSAVVLVGVLAVEQSRIAVTQQTRDDAGIRYPARAEAQAVALDLVKRAETADTYCIRSGSGGCAASGNVLQIRRPVMAVNGPGCSCVGVPAPQPCCFDIAANYQWDQYRLSTDGRDLRFFANINAGCGNVRAVVDQDPTHNPLTVTFTADPKGVGAMNIVGLTITWTHPNDGGPMAGQTMVFPGEIMLRVRSTDVTTGQDVNGVRPPPAACS
ncbi:MAG TPA: prepilin-type N-terminal cleavage/methylation domain-containing protein [Gemmatimonadaceae bacterium]